MNSKTVIQINPLNLKQIEAALVAEQGKARTYTFTAEEVVDLAVKMEARLERLQVAKSRRVGTVGTDQAGRLGVGQGKYNYLATRVEITRKANGWALTKVERGYAAGLFGKPWPHLRPAPTESGYFTDRARTEFGLVSE